MAHVGGVEGYYTCDGGCDKATVTDAYAKEIIKAVGAYHEYDRPLMATLANGETKPIIKGYIRADVEVTTPAGNVVLTNWHVDVMQGPTSEKLLYMGQREERELNLKSYKEQLTELAQKSKKAKKALNVDSPADETTNTRVQIDGKMRKVIFNPGQQPMFKRRLATGLENDTPNAQTMDDGTLFVNKDGWGLQKKVKYVVDPRVTETYVTTAALYGQEMKLEGKHNNVEIRAHDIEAGLTKWLGAPKPRFKLRMRGQLYVLPDEQHDIVMKLTILPNVVMRVIDSPVAAVIFGRDESRLLTQRRDEDLGLGDTVNDPEQINLRIEEMVEAARQAGMSAGGLRRASKMVRERFRHVWRTSLGPEDIANVPPLEIEVKGDIFELPKPYMRRYTAEEIKWWRESMAKLVQNGILRPTNSRVLSPSNLVKKVLNGEIFIA